MRPQEKAEELLDKMYYSGRYDDKEDYIPAMAWERAKQCALIAVDEMLDSYTNEHSYGYITSDKIIPYWQEVKQEIIKL
jgi:hypothetical protein